MSRRTFATRIIHKSAHGACEHHAIVPTSLPLIGRCLECGALVDVPFTLRLSRKDV